MVFFKSEMAKKFNYIAPDILKQVSVYLENGILAGSVVTKDSNVQTAGQQTETYDFSASSFNQVWE